VARNIVSSPEQQRLCVVRTYTMPPWLTTYCWARSEIWTSMLHFHTTDLLYSILEWSGRESAGASSGVARDAYSS